MYIVKEGEFKQTIRMTLPNQKSVVEPQEVYDNPLKAMKGANQFFVKNTMQTHEIVDL